MSIITFDVQFPSNLSSKLRCTLFCKHYSVIDGFTVSQIYSNDATLSNPQGELTLMKNGLTKFNNRSTASVDARFLCPRILFVKFGSIVTMAKNQLFLVKLRRLNSVNNGPKMTMKSNELWKTLH